MLHAHARPGQSHATLGTQLHVHLHVATAAIHVAITKRKLAIAVDRREKSFFIRPISNTDRLFAETDEGTKSDLRTILRSQQAGGSPQGREGAASGDETRAVGWIAID